MESKSKKSDCLKFLAHPPLMRGDDEQNYNTLYKEVECHLRPMGFMEHLSVRDLTDTIWEEQRHKRYQSKLIESAFHSMLIQVLTQIHQTDEWRARTDADNFFSEDAEERQAVVDLLHRYHIDIETIYAMAMSSNAPSIAMVERMLNNRKSWRSKLLKDHELRQQQIDKAHDLRFAAGSIA
jgi:hypothetical protein